MNTKPFENPASIDCGTFHVIAGAMPKHWDTDHEAERLIQITDNDQMERFLPDLCFDSRKEAKEWLKGITLTWASKERLPAVVRLNDPLVTVGYIICYTPARFENDEYDGWAIEYFLDEDLWGNEIMTTAVNNFLSYLQENNVERVRASSHSDNIASISLLQKIGFSRIGRDESRGDHIVHEIRLN